MGTEVTLASLLMPCGIVALWAWSSRCLELLTPVALGGTVIPQVVRDAVALQACGMCVLVVNKEHVIKFTTLLI